MLNYILIFSIITSIVLYFYFKTKQFRTTYMLPIRKKMYKSIAGSFLGLLLISFGLNQLVIFNELVNYIVATIFVLFGLYVLIFNYRAFKHYQKFVKEEAEINEH